MGLQTQLGLLLWKNFTLRKRQKVRLVVEVIWPLFLFFILVGVRSTNHPIYKGQCYYPNKAMPSAGVLPWMQGIMCNLDNPCVSSPTPGETPGQVNNFNSSIVAGVLIELQTLLSVGLSPATVKQFLDDFGQESLVLQNADLGNGQLVPLRSLLRDDESFTAFLQDELAVSPPTAESLMETSLRPNMIPLLLREQDLRSVLCEGPELERYLEFSSDTDRDVFQNLSCSLSPAQLRQTREAFQQNLDPRNLPLALGLNPTQTVELFSKMTTDMAPLVDQMLRTQRTLFSLTDGLDFTNDTFSSLNMLLCGQRPDFNSTATFTRARADSRAESENRDRSSQLPAQRNTSEFCQTFIDTLEGTPSLRYLWSTFRPLLQGKVLFTPDTPVTRQLMAQANSTFDALARLKGLGEAWEQNEPEIWDFFQNGSQVNTVRDLLRNPFFAAVLDQRLKGTGLTAALIANFLYNGPPEDRPAGMPNYDWRNAFNTTSQILEQLTKFIGCLDLDKFEAMSDEGALVDRALELLNEEKYWAGVVVEGLDANATQLPAFVKYKIRMDIEDVERSNKIKDRSWYPGARDNSFNDMRYVWGGFAYLQDMIDRGIVQMHTGKSQPLGVFAQQIPYPCYVDDAFISSIGGILPMFLVLSFMYTVCQIIKGLVLEKETRLKEVLRAVGARNGALWFAWFTENMVLLTVPCALISVMVKYGKVLSYSDPSVIFVFLLVFCVATVMQCFFISVFFSRANLAAACGGLIYFLLYLPHSLCYAWRDVMTFPVKIAVSLLSCVAFGYGCENFARYEEQGIGIQWHNIASSTEEGDGYSFLVSIVMMLIDAFIYWVLTWYIENVYPGQYGIPKPWYFPFTRSYWCGTAAISDLGTEAQAHPEDQKGTTLANLGDHKGYLEKPPPNVKVGVSVRNLVKIYKTGKKLAVDGLSMDFYENQITSFLGHNGAGKTTLMSILTGLFAPTSGTAIINGFDIRTDMDSIRKHLGMCPQHNVLFNDLTVEEHIYFYARLKGRSKKEVDIEIDQMIQDVGLPHKRKELAKNLSGGMQRKLSVAIAFVGGSNIVILDEPTAGVDPYARRGIWELLLKYKQGRTIILSTHHMDEADILGDRIAIISHGRMCCCGSSLFLKKCFGSGYYLTLVRSTEDKMAAQRPAVNQNSKDSQSDSLDDGIGSQSSSCSDPPDVADVSSLIRKHVPQAVFLEGIGQELTYILPYAGAKDGTFAQLFKELDLEMGELGITSYGISDTTLEEIFLKVAEDTGVDMEPQDKTESFARDWKQSPRELRRNSISAAKISTEHQATPQTDGTGVERKGRFTSKVEDWERGLSMNGKGSSVITGLRLIRRQFLALFIKRFHHARRSRKGLIAQVVLPAAFVCLALIFSLIVPPFREYPSLDLQPWMYGAPQNTFISVDEPNITEVSQVAESLLNDPGFGTRCMPGNPMPNLPCEPQKATDWFTPPVDPAVSDIFAKGNWSMANPSPDCECSTPERSIMLPDCPPGAGGLPPPQRTQNTTDTLHDLTGRNMTDYLLKTYEKSGKNRYGGISVGGVNSQVKLNESEIATVFEDLQSLFNSSQDNTTDQLLQDMETLLKELGTQHNVKVWFYNKGLHAMVSFLSVANNGILRGNLPPSLDPRHFGISVSNHPLNLTKEQLSYVAMATTSTDVVVSICVIFAMSFIPASFVLFLIQERVSKAKHLQFVSGVNPAVYWVANFAWDMCNYIVPCVIVIVIFLCFQQKSYVSPANLPALILLLVLYGWSITPMMYPASFLFSVPSTAYVVLTCINLFIGINGSVATFVMEMFDDENVSHINDIVKQVLLIFPHFCLGRGLIDMAKNQAIATLFQSLGEDRFEDPLGWDMVGKNLFAMAVEGAVMFAITLLIQYKFCCKARLVSVVPSSEAEEDEDVARERARISQGSADKDLLRICDLTKVYSGKKVPAVDRICVGVPAAECFGLLGINGAGKTTTFKMLTGDIAVSGGEAFLNGHSIRTEMQSVHQNMGYCPQFDAIDDLLTGREHLEFYARLRGVPEKEVAMVAEWGIQKLGLLKYSNKSAGTYSGGNKRKLSTAMALIGCPPVVFLDEPTTGMDPKARRFLWDCILSVIKQGRSVILTSHSMEECEALCSRMAIMVNGQFKCLGSIQHLKSRFGDGYTVIVRVGGSSPLLGPVEEFVRATFPGSVLKEKHHNTLQYQLPHVEGSLAMIFSQFTKHQQGLGVEDYSVSQTTLDQVFVNFARLQHDEDDDAQAHGNVDDAQAYDNVVDLTDETPAGKIK
ncbi:phospholipid-transporting ATPase ABCA1-like isoform X2 [Clupea harengus]|uniref:P-type phospholipid transporter n=1 Tax=Clupea harengus TaxID=7950 RepID=A0A6P8GPY9_CLUHA|nr:phospholipid-transporting ATPase ABCA1-like isoform X2 [Clupea harengus]